MKQGKITTPIGKLFWVQITPPGKRNYNDDGFEYVASVVLPIEDEDAKEFITSLDEFYKASHIKGKDLQSMGYKFCNEQGQTKTVVENSDLSHYIISFKTKTTFNDGNQKTIKVYNSKAKSVDLGDIKIGNESLGRINGTAMYYTNGKKDGVGLYLNALQLITLIPYESSGGFDDKDYKEGDFIELASKESQEEFTEAPSRL